MSTAKPLPDTTPLAQPYWDAAQNDRLCIQRCQQCQHWIHFPEHQCPRCDSTMLAFEQVSGLGRIDSYSVVHRSFVAGYDAETPYIIAWVELDEQEGLRVFSNVLDCDPDAVAIGQAVKVCFETRGSSGKMPQFCLNES